MIPLRDDNPTRLRPYVTLCLIGVCLGTFFLQLSLGEAGFDRLARALGVTPAALLGDQPLAPELQIVPTAFTVVTSMFLHGGFMHLAGNMLYLWIFGNNVEDAMGHARFVGFYLVSGLAATLAQSLPDPSSTIPMIGASGAISGVLGAYLLLYPHARVLVLIPIGLYMRLTYLPAWIMLVLWFALQLISSALTAGAGGGGVAWGAHIGGFIAGAALIPLFKRRDVRLWHAGRDRPH